MSPFTPLRVWAGLLRRHRVDGRYLPRAAVRVAVSAASTPLRVYERLRHGGALRRQALHPAPVFIVGVARSGTTHLHNLLACDPQFGWVTNWQAFAPSIAVSGARWLKPLLARLGPGRRPMDNVVLELDGPQEEDVALAGVSRHSALHSLSFPRDQQAFYDGGVTLEALTPDERRAWEADYLGVLRTASRLCGGKRLLLKSPTNTGKLPALAALFPEARFVHITRDPYLVFRSLVHAYGKVLPGAQLQAVEPARVEDDLVRSYRALVERYLADREALPPGRLAEVRFEDLEADPLGQLARLYDELSLGDFDAVRPEVDAYLGRLGRYEKNAHELDAHTVERVGNEWGFALDAFGYPRRGAAAGDAEPAGETAR